MSNVQGGDGVSFGSPVNHRSASAKVSHSSRRGTSSASYFFKPCNFRREARKSAPSLRPLPPLSVSDKAVQQVLLPRLCSELELREPRNRSCAETVDAGVRDHAGQENGASARKRYRVTGALRLCTDPFFHSSRILRSFSRRVGPLEMGSGTANVTIHVGASGFRRVACVHTSERLAGSPRRKSHQRMLPLRSGLPDAGNPPQWHLSCPASRTECRVVAPAATPDLVIVSGGA